MQNPFRRHHHSHSNANPFPAIITDVYLHVRYVQTNHGVHTVSKALLKGTTPIARVDGTKLELPDIASIDVFDDIGDGNGPQVIGTIPSPADTFEFTTGVLTVGNHNFTVVTNDTKGHKAAPSNTGSVTVEATLAAPAPVTDLTVTLVPDDSSASAATGTQSASPSPAPTAQGSGSTGT